MMDVINRQRKLKVVNTSLLNAKLGIGERKFALLQFAFLFYLCVTSAPPDYVDRVLFHVKSSKFRLMNRPLQFELFPLAKTQKIWLKPS